MNRRIPNHLKNRKRYAIIGDGECEIWYFQMLKKHNPSLPINIEPKLAVKTTLESQFKKIKEEFYDSYDKIFWIIDYDVILDQTKKCKKGDKPKNQEFKEYFDEILKYYNNKVVVIINNPCLEFWFLLHHLETSKSFSNCGQTEKDLKKIKVFQKFQKKPDFFIKGIDIFKLTEKNLKTALVNSKKLGNFDFKNPTRSVCEMWKFFEDKNIKSTFKIK